MYKVIKKRKTTKHDDDPYFHHRNDDSCDYYSGLRQDSHRYFQMVLTNKSLYKVSYILLYVYLSKDIFNYSPGW